MNASRNTRWNPPSSVATCSLKTCEVIAMSARSRNMKPTEEQAWVKMAQTGELAHFLNTDSDIEYRRRLAELAKDVA